MIRGHLSDECRQRKKGGREGRPLGDALCCSPDGSGGLLSPPAASATDGQAQRSDPEQ